MIHWQHSILIFYKINFSSDSEHIWNITAPFKPAGCGAALASDDAWPRATAAFRRGANGGVRQKRRAGQAVAIQHSLHQLYRHIV